MSLIPMLDIKAVITKNGKEIYKGDYNSLKYEFQSLKYDLMEEEKNGKGYMILLQYYSDILIFVRKNEDSENKVELYEFDIFEKDNLLKLIKNADITITLTK